ncbi:MAG: alpha/beta hydrolase family protein [Gordonia paraffinivorans]
MTILLPGDRSRPRPVLYLLDGAGKSGPVQNSEWVTKGRAREFFADKNVIGVLPVNGAGTFFTDWQRTDPRLGRPRWETFLTRDLPPLIDRTFGGDGDNTVAGLSMGAQSAIALVARHPHLYSGAASFSGCPDVDHGPNPAYVYATAATAGGDATNMWGPVGSAAWRDHDPSNHLDALRGKNLFFSVGNGVLGPLDRNRVPGPGQSVAQSIVQSIVLEKAANACTTHFLQRLTSAGVGYRAQVTQVGTHSWNYWAQALRDAWPTISRGKLG